MEEEEIKPLLPAWMLNPPRWILWRACLCSVAAAQMFLWVREGWTVRRSLSLPLFIAAVVAGAAVLAAMDLIEIRSL